MGGRCSANRRVENCGRQERRRSRSCSGGGGNLPMQGGRRLECARRLDRATERVEIILQIAQPDLLRALPEGLFGGARVPRSDWRRWQGANRAGEHPARLPSRQHAGRRRIARFAQIHLNVHQGSSQGQSDQVVCFLIVSINIFILSMV